MHERKIQLRVEDQRFLTGSANYTDDLKSERLRYMGFVRSPYACALIKSIDLSNASKNPNFVSALTGKQIKQLVHPLYSAPTQRPTWRTHLASELTRFVGEPIVAFLARDRYSLEDISEEIEVDYEPRAPLASIEESKRSESRVYEEWRDNLAATFEIKKGNSESAVQSSKYFASVSLGIKRQAGVPMEPRCLVATYENESDHYRVHSSVQSAHRLRNYLSIELGIPPESISVVTPDVGGGFGTKAVQSYPETAIACIFARRTGFDIKWISTRTEDFLETAPGRDEYATVELFCNAESKMTALRARVEGNVGVFNSLNVSMNNTMKLMPGVYKIPNLDLEGRCYLTNKSPGGPVRGAGRPEACFLIERVVDAMARKLGISPALFRKMNLIQPEDIPYQSGTGYAYDSGNFPLLLDTLLKSSDYENLLKERTRRNSENRKKLCGLGLALSIDDTGVHSIETAKVVLTQSGLVVFTGSSPHGQGLETSLAQVCSEELGLPLEKIKIVWGDTDKLPEGFGTYGSRSMAAGGSAVIDACRKLEEIILRKASILLGVVDPSKLKISRGKILGENSETIQSLEDLVSKTGSLEASSKFELSAYPFAGGGHLCFLSIDIETGKIEIEKYVVVDDCGKVINQTIVDGQIHGAVTHGIGGTLLEEFVYGEECSPLSTNLLTYFIPSSTDYVEPEIFHLEFPSPLTLNGAKGVGETGTIGAYPAIFNALNDALSFAGAELNIAPATPEAVFKALHSGLGSRTSA